MFGRKDDTNDAETRRMAAKFSADAAAGFPTGSPQVPNPAAQSAPPQKPQRPGDTPPRPFVTTSRASLEKLREAHAAELALLRKDIEKLDEEARQLEKVLASYEAALHALEGNGHSEPEEPEISDADLAEAIKHGDA